MSKFNSGKISVLVLTVTFTVVTLLLGKSLASSVHATSVDQCDEVFEYSTKTDDFDDARININYHDSDQQIDVSAHSGYIITEVALEVPDDGYSGFHVYATGPISNFNPPGGNDITGAKVKAKKVCATASPSATPTATPKPHQFLLKHLLYPQAVLVTSIWMLQAKIV